MAMIDRRTLLKMAATTGVSLAIIDFSAADPAHLGLARLSALAGDEYDTLRQRWVDKTLLGAGYDPSAEPFTSLLAGIGSSASSSQSTMSPSASSLWPDLPLGSASANISGSFARLKTMAQAWTFPGTGYTGNSTMLADLITGLDWMTSHFYTATTTSYNNWWDWQIGSPKILLDICALIYSSLSAAQVTTYLASIDHFVPDSKVAVYESVSTGANRVDFCQVLVLRGVIGKNSAKIALGRDALSPVFPQVRSGDGFYADGSFIQHENMPYMGGYGFVLFNGFANLFSLLAGSSWPVTDPNRQLIFDAVPQAVAPFLFNGLIMDNVSGRGISRGIANVNNPLALQQDDHTRGHSLIGAIVLLADAAPATDAAQMRAMAKGWLQRDYYSPMLADYSQHLHILALGKSVLENGSITAMAEPFESRVFGSQDRATHRRPGWAFTVGMCSTRTAMYETINGENLRGWHTGSGMTYWWGNTFGNGQYSDAFWPTVDPYRLPGTTVSRKPLANSAGGPHPEPPADATWVGGVTDGTYSALGQDTRGVTSTVRARKAWFCLDDQVVCLGAGITSSDGHTVESTVENRNLGATSAAALVVDGVTQPTTQGWSATLTAAGWASIAGVGGYIFPGQATVKAVREERTGDWNDINVRGATTALTRRYLTLWFDHGINPTSGSYSYILMPGATSATTASRAAAPTVTVLANTAAVQAITDSATGVTAANFYVAGTAGPITVSAPCSVLMRESGGVLTISVSDPTRAASTITVTISRSGYTAASHDVRMAIIGLDPIKVVVEAGGSQGSSHTARFGTGAPVTAGKFVNVAPVADAFVRDGTYASTNYGSSATLVVKNAAAGYHRRSFLKFDLSGLTAAPRRAVLWVSGNTADSGGSQASVKAHAVSTDSWTATEVTWANQPALGAVLSAADIGGVKDWIPFDVTSHIQAQYAGDDVATIGLAQTTPGLAVSFTSGKGTDRTPYLEVITN